MRWAALRLRLRETIYIERQEHLFPVMMLGSQANCTHGSPGLWHRLCCSPFEGSGSVPPPHLRREGKGQDMATQPSHEATVLPVAPRNQPRQPGCAMCLTPNKASGASALAAAFVIVALTGGPYVTPQCCAVLRPLLSRRHGLTSGSVRDQTGTCRPLDATSEDGSNTGIIHAGALCAMLPNTTG